MSRTVGVVGMGNVGSVVAHYIVDSGVADTLVLFDKRVAKVKSDAIDFQDAMPNLPHHTTIKVNDYSALKNADVVISALGHVSAIVHAKKKNDRSAELLYNAPEVKQVGTDLKKAGFHGVLLVITNPCDVMTYLYQKVTGLPKHRVMGTGTLLDSARMKKAVGNAFHVDPRSVHGYNLGEHGDSQFTAWSTVRVLDQPVTKLAKSHHLDLETINETVRKGGWLVFRGKHCTQYGVATAAVHLANLVMSDSHAEVPVSNFRPEYHKYLSYPAVVGRTGLLRRVNLDLTDKEKKQLQASSNAIQKNIDKLHASEKKQG